MIAINRTYAPIQAFVEELARCGMRDAVTSPGSRNAPLALCLAGQQGVRAHSVIDERAAGFVALGLAKASGRPVAVTCTSGSAAANLLPAVVEAHEARVPLLVLTADRPPELRDTGAGQAIDQLGLYGSFAKWFVEVGNHEPGRATAIHHRALACRAWHTAGGGRAGVCHLNFPLREPLAPTTEPLDLDDWQGRPDGGPWLQLHSPAAAAPDELVEGMAARIADVERGAIVVGAGAGELADAVPALARATGWPILAEPTSGLRRGPHDRSHVVAHYDVLLRDVHFAREHQPQLLLRIGDAPTSKPLRAWLAQSAQLVVDPNGTWHEPTRVAETVVQAEPAALCAAIANRLGEQGNDDWTSAWTAADALVPPAIAAVPEPFEPSAFTAAADAVPPGVPLWVASSMAIRDFESFLAKDERPLRMLANRGAGGSAFVATGELALLHDVGGLLAASRLGAELTIVCVNNGGGGIFDFLPVAGAAAPDPYEHHIVTPSGVDLKALAALAGLEHRLATTAVEVRAAASEPGLIEVVTDRRENVERHREVFAAVAERLAPSPQVSSGSSA